MTRSRKFLALAAGLAIFSLSVPAAVAANVPLPVYASKPGKNGLFPEETISMKELRAKQLAHEKMVLLDARGKGSYDATHITGAVLPLSAEYYKAEELFRAGLVKAVPDRDKDLAAAVQKYPKNTPMVAYCNDGCQASAVLVLQLKHLGFANVRAMDDGIQSWQAKGYPVVSEKK